MTSGQMILLSLGGLIFAAWTVQMFRALFRMRRRAVARSGQVFPGLGETLHQWGRWLRSDADRRDRRALGLTTLVLFAWIGVSAAMAS